MSDRIETFDVDDAPAIEITSNAGDIVIRRGEPGRASIALSGPSEVVEEVMIEVAPDLISIRTKPTKARFFTRRVDMIVTVPSGGTLRAEVGAGSLRVLLPMEEVVVSAGSGEVRIDKTVGDLTVKVGSGDVCIGTVSRRATIASAQGDIRVNAGHDLRIDTASGDVRVGEVSGVARIKSASGDVVVLQCGCSQLEVKTMSGDTRLGLVPGMDVKANVKTLSGDFRNRITPSGAPRIGSMTLDVESFSGDVTLNTAEPLSESPSE